MKKLTVIFMLLAMMGCGGGGSSEVTAPAFTQDQNDAIVGSLNSYNNKLQADLQRLKDLNIGTHTTDTYIGFTAADFSGKTLYLVEQGTYSKVECLPDGRLKAYFPDQETEFEVGAWTMSIGKLIIVTTSTLDTYALYTLLSDDEANQYFKTSQQWKDGSVNTIGIFYDQVTGKSQAQDFVDRLRIP
jgi:hypothetical protein